MRRELSRLRLIAFDLDGTLLRSDKTISDRTLAALHKAAERGIALVPASGRSLMSIPREIRHLRGVKYIITCNGAAVYTPDGELVHEAALERGAALKIMSGLEGFGGVFGAYIAGNGYMERRGLDMGLAAGLPQEIINYFKNTRILTDWLDGFIAMQEHNIQLLTIAAPESNTAIRKKAAFAAANAGLICVNGSRTDIDISRVGADKGTALKIAADLCGTDTAQTIAFGDSENDIELLRAAGVAVAMGNAADRVKAAADITAPSNDSDGMAHIIEQLLQGAEV